MISKTAQADIEEMWENGLKPTFADIIRLNALALAVERVRSGFALSTLPRVAFLGSAALREPTIGSEIWMELASRLFNSKDCETFIMLRAFSLSRPFSELPDAADEKAVLAAMGEFRDSIGFATVRQLVAAIGYAVHGFNPSSGEKPTPKPDAGEAGDIIDTCYEVGLLRMGMLHRLGTAADIKALTPRAAQEMLYRAIARDTQSDARKDAVSAAEDDYLRTLDEITDRLKAASSPEKPGERRVQEGVDVEALANESERTEQNAAAPNRIADRAEVSSAVAGADGHSTSPSGVT